MRRYQVGLVAQARRIFGKFLVSDLSVGTRERMRKLVEERLEHRGVPCHAAKLCMLSRSKKPKRTCPS